MEKKKRKKEKKQQKQLRGAGLGGGGEGAVTLKSLHRLDGNKLKRSPTFHSTISYKLVLVKAEQRIKPRLRYFDKSVIFLLTICKGNRNHAFNRMKSSFLQMAKPAKKKRKNTSPLLEC